MLTLFTELNKKLLEFSKYVKQQSRSRLTKSKRVDSKALYNSISVDTNFKNKSSSVTFIMKKYGAYVDQGVKGTKSTYSSARNSPFKYKQSSKVLGFELATGTFAKWAKRKKFRFRDEKGRFKKGNYKSIGVAIALSIKKKGLRGNGFFTKSLDTGVKKYENEFFKAIENDINNFLLND